MIGNDIVWLADERNRGRSADRRLLDRILTPQERLLVSVSDDPDRRLWSLWAAKEAAYKSWSQEYSGAFSPSRFCVEVHPERGARVVLGAWSTAVSWAHGADWVHALAGTGTVRIAVIDGNGSAAVRALAVSTLREAGGPEAEVRGRPPRFFRDGLDLGLDLSLSHDGPYGAVAFNGLNNN